MAEVEQQNEQLKGMCAHGNFPESCEACKANDELTADKEKIEGVQTKEAAQQELQEKFGITDTAAFRQALEQGDIETAKKWLEYITDNKEKFPQYQDTWDNWSKDRKQEISQQELSEQFGMRKTSDFRQALEEGKIKEAEEWLQHILNNRDQFPQYNDSWFEDRQKELERV